MIDYFPQCEKDIIEHGRYEAPYECCGVIVDGVYNRCENKAGDPERNFIIDPEDYYQFIRSGRVEAVIHSHHDFPHSSKDDMLGQINTGVPYGIVFFDKGVFRRICYFGDELPIQDLLVRPFVHGIYDCYALVRDFYRLHDHQMVQFPREVLWWNTDEKVFDDCLDKSGFSQVEDPEPGDVVLMRIKGKSTNHCGIVLDKGLVLHHLWNRPSRVEPLKPWHQMIVKFVRPAEKIQVNEELIK